MKWIVYTPHPYASSKEWLTHAFWFILIQITPIVWGYLFNTITAGYMTMYYFVTAINIGVLLLAVYETRKYGHPLNREIEEMRQS
jgi:hypothetical protein